MRENDTPDCFDEVLQARLTPPDPRDGFLEQLEKQLRRKVSLGSTAAPNAIPNRSLLWSVRNIAFCMMLVGVFVFLLQFAIRLVPDRGQDPAAVGILSPTVEHKPSTATTTPAPWGSATPIQANSQSTMTATLTSTPNTTVVRTLVSPDGEWIAEASSVRGKSRWSYAGNFLPTLDPNPICDDHIYHLQVNISSTQQEKLWKVVDMIADGGVGYDMPRLLGWSQDSHHLYFRISSTRQVNCNPLWFSGQDSVLFRFNVTSGKVEQVDVPSGVEHMFSPDETQLAYLDADQLFVLRMLDLTTKDEEQIDIPRPIKNTEMEWSLGDLVWSPDGKSLTVSVVLAEKYDEPYQFWLLRLDTDSDKLTTLVDASPDYFDTVRWPVVDEILLIGQVGSYWIDARTGEVTTAP